MHHETVLNASSNTVHDSIIFSVTSGYFGYIEHCSKVWKTIFFFKEVTCAQQKCMYLIKDTIKV